MLSAKEYRTQYSAILEVYKGAFEMGMTLPDIVEGFARALEMMEVPEEVQVALLALAGEQSKQALADRAEPAADYSKGYAVIDDMIQQENNDVG